MLEKKSSIDAKQKMAAERDINKKYHNDCKAGREHSGTVVPHNRQGRPTNWAIRLGWARSGTRVLHTRSNKHECSSKQGLVEEQKQQNDVLPTIVHNLQEEGLGITSTSHHPIPSPHQIAHLNQKTGREFEFRSIYFSGKEEDIAAFLIHYDD